MSDALQVYLTREDWLDVAARFEPRAAVRYVRVGAVDGAVQGERCLADLAAFGVAPTGDQATNPQFLILPADSSPCDRVAERRADWEVRVVDRQGNPGGVLVSPGGAFGATAVIVGEVAASVQGDWAIQTRSALCEAVCGVTEERSGFRVGRDALRRLRRGARLTPYVDGDTLYDLQDS